MVVRRRSDEDQSGGADGFGETRVLGKKSIARMNCAGAASARCVNDRVDTEITFAGRRRTDADSFIGQPHAETVLVGFAEDGDGA